MGLDFDYYGKRRNKQIHVSFPKGLITSSHQQISFRNGVSASGEIVTEDVRLIERLF